MACCIWTLYVYDANGERVLRRSTNSSGTTMTVYAFGLEEHQYSGSGTLQSNLYYYSLAGRLIGALDSSGTTFYLSDALGSLLASFSNAANSAALKSNQLYGPYGNTCYAAGTLTQSPSLLCKHNTADTTETSDTIDTLDASDTIGVSDKIIHV